WLSDTPSETGRSEPIAAPIYSTVAASSWRHGRGSAPTRQRQWISCRCTRLDSTGRLVSAYIIIPGGTDLSDKELPAFAVGETCTVFEFCWIYTDLNPDPYATGKLQRSLCSRQDGKAQTAQRNRWMATRCVW